MVVIKKTITSYSFNGKSYSDFNDLPDNVKRQLQDKDQNGMPDVVDQALEEVKTSASQNNEKSLAAFFKQQVSSAQRPNLTETAKNFRSQSIATFILGLLAGYFIGKYF